jgi:hypothetical protein
MELSGLGECLDDLGLGVKHSLYHPLTTMAVCPTNLRGDWKLTGQSQTNVCCPEILQDRVRLSPEDSPKPRVLLVTFPALFRSHIP